MEMEDAYNELFREFVHLRSICIRQAALLQKLSRELHKQQGSNGTFWKHDDNYNFPFFNYPSDLFELSSYIFFLNEHTLRFWC